MAKHPTRIVRKLTDAHLAACRWEYENSACSQRYLARKYGVHRGAIEYWIEVGGWLKYTSPGEMKKLTKQQAAEFDRQVKDAAAEAHDEVLAQGLAKSLGGPPMPKKAQRIAKRQAGPHGPPAVRPGTPFPPPVPPAPQQTPPEEPAKPVGDSAKPAKAGKAPGAHVIPFPGAKPPPKPPEATIFPTRSKEEQAELQVHLSTLRGMMSLQQLQQVERHKRILAEVTHLLSVYLTPHDYVKTEGLEEEDAQEKLLKVQRAALTLLLPTEGDTLAGTLRALTNSLKDTITLERAIAGLALGGGGGRGPTVPPADPALLPQADMSKLRSDELRIVRAGQLLLAGEVRRESEPPRPPPPDSLEDLRRVMDPEEEVPKPD
jgi:hypothetical protein